MRFNLGANFLPKGGGELHDYLSMAMKNDGEYGGRSWRHHDCRGSRMHCCIYLFIHSLYTRSLWTERRTGWREGDSVFDETVRERVRLYLHFYNIFLFSVSLLMGGKVTKKDMIVIILIIVMIIMIMMIIVVMIIGNSNNNNDSNPRPSLQMPYTHRMQQPAQPFNTTTRSLICFPWT